MISSEKMRRIPKIYPLVAYILNLNNIDPEDLKTVNNGNLLFVVWEVIIQNNTL